MEQMTPDQNPQAPERKRKQQPQKQFPFPLPAFLTEIGKDVQWYYDVRLWLPVILVALVLATCTGSKLRAAEPQETNVPETQAVVQTEPVLETQEPTVPLVNPEAEALAILADSVGIGRSDNVKTIIMWVAVNRSEDYAHGHGLTLEEEIARPNQWQGYDPNGSYSQETYDIALEVLSIRDTGGLRPLDGDMLWMVLNNDGSVSVRNQFTNDGTKNWREKTFK